MGENFLSRKSSKITPYIAAFIYFQGVELHGSRLLSAFILLYFIFIFPFLCKAKHQRSNENSCMINTPEMNRIFKSLQWLRNRKRVHFDHIRVIRVYQKIAVSRCFYSCISLRHICQPHSENDSVTLTLIVIISHFVEFVNTDILK